MDIGIALEQGEKDGIGTLRKWKPQKRLALLCHFILGFLSLLFFFGVIFANIEFLVKTNNLSWAHANSS